MKSFWMIIFFCFFLKLGFSASGLGDADEPIFYPWSNEVLRSTRPCVIIFGNLSEDELKKNSGDSLNFDEFLKLPNADDFLLVISDIFSDYLQEKDVLDCMFKVKATLFSWFSQGKRKRFYIELSDVFNVLSKDMKEKDFFFHNDENFSGEKLWSALTEKNFFFKDILLMTHVISRECGKAKMKDLINEINVFLKKDIKGES